jgi:hypothetical protein
MPLTKTPINITFSQGIDTKTDDKAVPVGRFLDLENMVQEKSGLLQKRYGFQNLPSLPDDSNSYVTTFNGTLTAIGNTLNAFSNSSQKWIPKSTLQPVSLATQPVVRSATNQTQVDSTVSPSGTICTVYTDVNAGSTSYKYVIQDSNGQNVSGPSVITPSAGVMNTSPRVFTLGNYFIIVFGTVISTVEHLQYVAINLNTQVVNTAVDISTNFTYNASCNFDGIVADNFLYLAWNGNDGGGAIRVRYLTPTLNRSNEVVASTGHAATVMSVTADLSTSIPVIYVSWYNSGTSTGYVLAEQQSSAGAFVQVLTPIEIITTGSIANLASAANDNIVTIFYETNNTYGYDSNIPTNYVSSLEVSHVSGSVTGSVSAAFVVDRGVGLASKAFFIDNAIYVTVAYDGKSSTSQAFQPTNFLINAAGEVIARLSYSNSGGYVTAGLPSANVNGSDVQIAYLYRDSIIAANPTQNVAQAAGIFAQTGINQVTYDFSPSTISAGEIGGVLNISSGLGLWSYDGTQSVENNFFIYPDSVECTNNTVLGTMAEQAYQYAAIYTFTDASGNPQQSSDSIPVNVTTVLNSVNFSAADIIVSPSVFSGTIAIGPTTYALPTGTAVQFTTSGTLPTGLSVSTTYYVIHDSNITFRLATTLANALAFVPITFPSGGAGSGNSVMTPFGAAQSGVSVYIPTLRLSYKTTVKIEVYRWSAAQQNFYEVTTINAPLLNDPTVDYLTLQDTLPDSSIIGNKLLYTTGSVLPDDAPPASEIMTLYKSRVFLLNSEDQNSIWFSKTVIEGTPVEFSAFQTIYIAPTIGPEGSSGVVTALGTQDDKLIIFKAFSAFYFVGEGPDATGANSDYVDPVYISMPVGCSNQASIVYTTNGLMFQASGGRGIWLLNRELQGSYIGSPAEAFNGYNVTSAINDPSSNQVRFKLDDNAGTVLVYDYYFNTWYTHTNLPSISSTLYAGLDTFIDSFGKVWQENQGSYVDGSNPVLIKFTPAWYNLAGIQGYQRAYFFDLIGSFISPHKLVVSIAYDYNPSPTQQTVITPRNYNAPWGGDSTWGQSTPWGGTPTLEQWKVFFARQTCMAFQITIQEVFDPSFGTVAGAGFTLSGINCVVGIKKGYRPLNPNNQTG